jgi:hypothetical protein
VGRDESEWVGSRGWLLQSLGSLASWVLAPSHERRLLAPEDAGWVGFDLLEYLVDAAWREIAVAVPAAIAIGPVQVPFVGAGAVTELRDAPWTIRSGSTPTGDGTRRWLPSRRGRWLRSGPGRAAGLGPESGSTFGSWRGRSPAVRASDHARASAGPWSP